MLIRELTLDDLDACLDLAESRRWGREERKWRFLLEGGEGYGIADPDGALVATTILTRYGARTAAVSMVLVAEPRERRGLAGRLVRHAVERAGGATVFLNATAMGRPLYERLGFRATGAAAMHVGVFGGDAAEASRAAVPEDLKAIADLDAEVVGATGRRCWRGTPASPRSCGWSRTGAGGSPVTPGAGATSPTPSSDR